MKIDLNDFNKQKTLEKIQDFLEKVFVLDKNAVLALSGGIDSSLSLSITSRVLTHKNIYVLLLPYKDQDMNRAYDFAKSIVNKQNIFIFNIFDSVEQIKKSLKIKDDDKNLIRIGNIMARVRMTFLFDFAKKTNSLVIGTENKSELLLGYFTRFGDSASDVEPIISLYKTQVRSLARFLDLPDWIIAQPPSAGLWENQTDEKELGFSYEDADKILYLYFDKKIVKLNKLIEIGQENNIQEEIVKKIFTVIEKNLFKLKVPYTLENT